MEGGPRGLSSNGMADVVIVPFSPDQVGIQESASSNLQRASARSGLQEDEVDLGDSIFPNLDGISVERGAEGSVSAVEEDALASNLNGQSDKSKKSLSVGEWLKEKAIPDRPGANWLSSKAWSFLSGMWNASTKIMNFAKDLPGNVWGGIKNTFNGIRALYGFSLVDAIRHKIGALTESFDYDKAFEKSRSSRDKSLGIAPLPHTSKYSGRNAVAYSIPALSSKWIEHLSMASNSDMQPKHSIKDKGFIDFKAAFDVLKQKGAVTDLDFEYEHASGKHTLIIYVDMRHFTREDLTKMGSVMGSISKEMLDQSYERLRIGAPSSDVPLPVFETTAPNKSVDLDPVEAGSRANGDRSGLDDHNLADERNSTLGGRRGSIESGMGASERGFDRLRESVGHSGMALSNSGLSMDHSGPLQQRSSEVGVATSTPSSARSTNSSASVSRGSSS